VALNAIGEAKEERRIIISFVRPYETILKYVNNLENKKEWLGFNIVMKQMGSTHTSFKTNIITQAVTETRTYQPKTELKISISSTLYK
jgi:hypothetical protein